MWRREKGKGGGKKNLREGEYGEATKPGSPKRVKGQCPLQGAGTASLLGFGATPQLFLVQPTQKENSSGAALVAGSEASLRSNFARPQTRPPISITHNLHIVAPMGATG